MNSEQTPSTGVLQMRSEILIAVALLSASFICTCLFAALSPQAAPTLLIPSCREVPPNTHRISARARDLLDGIAFDVPETDFVVETGTQDMPPGEVHLVTLRGRSERLEISDYDLSFEQELKAFSAHEHRREVRTSDGRKIGEDHWGYLTTGERWRYLRFIRGGEDGYRPMLPKYADLLDKVINSACLAPVPVGH